MPKKFLVLNGLFWGAILLFSVLLGSIGHFLLFNLGPVAVFAYLALVVTLCLWAMAWLINKHQ